MVKMAIIFCATMDYCLKFIFFFFELDRTVTCITRLCDSTTVLQNFVPSTDHGDYEHEQQLLPLY